MSARSCVRSQTARANANPSLPNLRQMPKIYIINPVSPSKVACKMLAGSQCAQPINVPCPIGGFNMICSLFSAQTRIE